MKEATKRAASEALAQMLAVTAMLVIASLVFYVAVSQRERATKQSSLAATPMESQCTQCSTGHVTFSKYGTSRPANGTNRAVTLSPMARSLSPWAIMRKPSAVSTSTML